VLLDSLQTRFSRTLESFHIAISSNDADDLNAIRYAAKEDDVFPASEAAAVAEIADVPLFAHLRIACETGTCFFDCLDPSICGVRFVPRYLFGVLPEVFGSKR
jgi:hypothetical protein